MLQCRQPDFSKVPRITDEVCNLVVVITPYQYTRNCNSQELLMHDTQPFAIEVQFSNFTAYLYTCIEPVYALLSKNCPMILFHAI